MDQPVDPCRNQLVVGENRSLLRKLGVLRDNEAPTFMVLGAGVGYLYYKIVGCRSGACFITS
ncbi:MAG: hypothetical protein JW702_09360, partial [Clostridiales bacterium]|nr:hypothetical protein [Clostridiales bacterium]